MLKKTIALTGGSTGWHVFPLQALYNYLEDTNDYNFLWFGEQNNLEEEISKKSWIAFYDISAGKLRRYFDYRNLYEPFKNLTGIVESLFFIKKHKIDIVFSKWWYVSLPMAIWAKIMRKKLFVHESDTVSGLSNKIVSKLADKVFYSFDNENIDNIKHILAWQILNPELLDWLNNLIVLENTRQKILVTWGSQGSTAIFESLLKILPELDFIDFTILLWEKNRHLKEVFDKFSYVKVFDFVSQKDLWNILKNTDLAISRAWATSLWEQNIFGVHSIIIPLPNSAWNHQELNAKYFSKKFESDILKQDDNLSFNLKNKLLKYKNLRKAGLNLDNFFWSLKIIKANMK